MAFVFLFVYMVDYIDIFSYVEASLHLCIIVDDGFGMFLDSVYKYLIEYICISVHEGYWFEILFLF